MTDDQLYDFRYPFNSIIDFFSGKYFLKIEALHLTVGYIALFYFIVRVMTKKRLPLSLRFALIYFAGTIFNNFAYSLSGVTIADFFGILAVLLFIGSRFRIRLNPLSKYMLFFASVALIQLLLVSLFDETLLQSLDFKRFAVIFKIFVLSINIIILFTYLDDNKKIEMFIKNAIFLFNIVAICYIIQILVFVSGTLPYGSFSPAGWSHSIVPSFGSVSIERGHLGKFFVPLFPLYLFAYNKYRYKKSIILFFLVAFLNFSASAYIFLLTYLFLSSLLFYKELKFLIFMGMTFITIILIYFHEQIFTLFEKVYELAIVQDASGGRSFGLIIPIWHNYPFGYGYGGSTFRNLHGIEGLDLNNSIVVFWGELSFVGVLIVLAFSYLIYRVFRFVKTVDRQYLFEKKLFLISFLTMLLIFSADVLYFSPTVWLPVVLLFIYLQNTQKQPCAYANYIR